MGALPWVSIFVTDAGGLAAGAWLLFGRRPIGATSWRSDATRWGLLGMVLGAGALAVGGTLGGGFFVLRLLCHALFCVLVPLALVRGAQRRGAAGIAVVVLGLFAEGAYVFALRVEPFRLELTRHEIVSERLAGRAEPLRVAVLADLQTDHVGTFEQRVFDELDGLQPDLVLLPGDVIQLEHGSLWERQAREKAELRRLFDGLHHRPRLGFLMVQGDCDPDAARFDDCGVRLLRDEVVTFADEGVQIIALSPRASRRPLDARFLDAARAFPGLTLVMGHAPEFALSAPTAGVPLLCVAGHTHGGQVQLPFLGPLLTLSRVPRSIAGGGLHRLGDSWVCVSRGIGMERNLAPRIRFLCRPEIVVFDLAPSQP